jgi:hypothetical protein
MKRNTAVAGDLQSYQIILQNLQAVASSHGNIAHIVAVLILQVPPYERNKKGVGAALSQMEPAENLFLNLTITKSITLIFPCMKTVRHCRRRDLKQFHLN